MKILLIDIETAPKTAYVWGLWKQNVSINQLAKDMYVLNWTAKWLNDEYYYSDALHYHKLYKKDPTDDRRILQGIWDMLDQADIVVAHNGDRFDIPTLNSRFLLHGFPPPSSFKTVDTLKIARRKFRLTSNKLEFLARELGIGSKIDTGGFELWRDIIEKQDIAAFDRMVEYCEHDTLLLEEVYKKLAPWDNRHPSTVLHKTHTESLCNVCGSDHIVLNGTASTNSQIYVRYRCQSCGHNMRSAKAIELPKETKESLLRSI